MLHFEHELVKPILCRFFDLIWHCFSLQIDIALNFIVQHIYIVEVYRHEKLVLS